MIGKKISRLVRGYRHFFYTTFSFSMVLELMHHQFKLPQYEYYRIALVICSVLMTCRFFWRFYDGVARTGDFWLDD